MDLTAEIKKIFDAVERRIEPTTEGHIGDLLKTLKSKLTEKDKESFELVAESMAFSFVENCAERDSGWGTYYGPMVVLSDEAGNLQKLPSIEFVSPETIRYWSTRAEEAKHPVTKARYADLVWDFSKEVTGTGADVAFARIVIDENLNIAQQRLHKYETIVIIKLKRALNLALAINDEQRIGKIIDTIINYEDRIAVDQVPGLWGFSFDILINNKKIKLSEQQRNKIISDLESRLKRVVTSGIGSPIDPFAAEAAAMRLARYYTKEGLQEEAKRIIGMYAEVFIGASKTASPLAAVSWLEKVHSVLISYGMKEDADKVAILIREAGERSRDEMRLFSQTMEISKNELETFLEEMTQGNVAEVLRRIAIYFMPQKSQIENQMKDIAKQAPLQSLIAISIQDSSGRTLATVGPLHEDPKGRLIHHMSQNMQFESKFLYLVLDRAQARHNITAEKIFGQLSLSPLFNRERRELIIRGLSAHFQGDYYASCCILIPEIEAALRRLLHIIGGSIYKPSRMGGLLERNLDEIIRDELVQKVLPEDIIIYFQALLVDQRGWNLRNNICHGLMLPNMFNISISNRIIHSLLVLSLIQEQEGQ